LAAHADTSQLHAAARSLLEGQRIILITGFCIRAMMVGETDGPPGALALALALRQLGKEVILVTDRFSSELLAAGEKQCGEQFVTHVLGSDQPETNRRIRTILDTHQPTHVVAIERPGSAQDGHRYSMRGEMLDDLVPATDLFLTPEGPRNYQTIAIGDGGNELGMGSLFAALRERVTHGDLIFCTTVADHVIPAGISNWGAYALIGALSILSGINLLHETEHEKSILHAMVEAGAVDGCTRKRTLSVDGIGWDDYAQTVADISVEVSRFLDNAS
jgi:Domain of unknown function (DUF4392)